MAETKEAVADKASEITDSYEFPYSEIPNFPVSTYTRKLRNAERAKYEIHNAVKDALKMGIKKKQEERQRELSSEDG